MSFSAATLLLPASDASWRLWKPRATAAGETVERPADLRAQAKALVVGLPASACRTIGLVLPNADHDVLEQIIVTHLERRGLRMETGRERNFRWHLLSQTAALATVSVDVLADPFPEDLAVPHAEDYISALRLTTLPNAHLVIVEEQGSLVLAFGLQGKLYHSHIFGAATASVEEIAQELTLAQFALEAELGAGRIHGIALAGDSWNAATVQQLTALIDLPVRAVGTLPPNGDIETKTVSRLLPASVRNAQSRAALKSKWLRIGLIGGLTFIGLIVFALVYLQWKEQEADRLAEAVSATDAPASEVRKTANRWKALSPALEPKRYPLVLLSEITKILPPSGIVIRDFNVKGEEIDIQGEARDAQLAFQFVEDLKKNRTLGRYTWTMPQPTVREKTATFRAQGKAL